MSIQILTYEGIIYLSLREKNEESKKVKENYCHLYKIVEGRQVKYFTIKGGEDIEIGKFEWWG